MRTKILVLSAALVLSANLHAQVTIGELATPATGALLDLNKATKGGLLLSNVPIEDLSKIPATLPNSFPGIVAGTNDDTNTAFTGAMVYHIGGNNIPVGIYVWNGTNWAPVEENCTPLVDASQLTLTTPVFNIKKDATETFSVSSDASARCADGETYEWSVQPATGSEILSQSTATTSIKFTETGAYDVTVTVKSPYSSAPVSKTGSVNVTATGGGVPYGLLSADYGIVGETCLDVKKSQLPGQSDLAFNARKDAFELGVEKTYKFLHKGAYSGLVLSYYDDPDISIVESIDVTALPQSAFAEGTHDDDYNYEKAFTVKFKPNIKELVPDNGDSLTVKLVATYIPEGGSDTKVAYLEIRVENGTCVCPAKVSATEWLNFMCHNLNAKYDIISSFQLITRDHHGDWYRWAYSSPAVYNTANNDNRSAWSTTWPTGARWEYTCPSGWRLPTEAEYSSLAGNNILSNIPDPWIPIPNRDWNGGFCNLKKVGDYLYFPAAGEREYAGGALRDRGNFGYYWSSSVNSWPNDDLVWYFRITEGSANSQNKRVSPGYSLRCVSE
ncbi:MAG: hypothetical protein LBP72_08125 [Dysgonamonadaceae bacterium]|jgi:uncharacterized protein (TIGR02145 family)|nr:hypothetical protein [Dysgonamonadaceae bacterium]